MSGHPIFQQFQSVRFIKVSVMDYSGTSKVTMETCHRQNIKIINININRYNVYYGIMYVSYHPDTREYLKLDTLVLSQV